MSDSLSSYGITIISAQQASSPSFDDDDEAEDEEGIILSITNSSNFRGDGEDDSLAENFKEEPSFDLEMGQSQ